MHHNENNTSHVDVIKITTVESSLHNETILPKNIIINNNKKIFKNNTTN